MDKSRNIIDTFNKENLIIVIIWVQPTSVNAQCFRRNKTIAIESDEKIFNSLWRNVKNLSFLLIGEMNLSTENSPPST